MSVLINATYNGNKGFSQRNKQQVTLTELQRFYVEMGELARRTTEQQSRPYVGQTEATPQENERDSLFGA